MPSTLSRRSVLQLGAASMLPPRLCFATEPSGFGERTLREDVRILRHAFETLHPGLNRYATPAEMAGRFDRLEQAFSRAGSLEAAFLTLSHFTAGVRCGHTYPNPFNQHRETKAALFGGRRLAPFNFRWLGTRMVVTRDLSGQALFRRGDEVVRMAGTEPGALLKRLMLLSRADGAADAKRVNNLELRGAGRYEAFDVYAPLLEPALRERAVFTVRALDGALRRFEAPLLTHAEKQALKPVVDENAALWRIDRLAGGAVRLTMPTWVLFNSKWDWKAWLNGVIDTLAIEKTPALIIDLRGNEGGLDVGDLIISRLIDRELTPKTFRRFTRYRRAPEALHPFLDTWDRSFLDWGAAAVGPDARGFYRLQRGDENLDGEVIRPAGKRYGGRVLVLVDASNSSATFQFASALAAHRLATLVGQTTGGNQRGINGGAFFFMRLPGSGLEVDLPLIAYMPDTPRPDAPIEPHAPVAITPRDIAGGVDRALDLAVKLSGVQP